MEHRGRNRCWIMPADDVRRAIGIKSQQSIADYFGVSARTVRRWITKGCALYFGAANARPEDWETIEAARVYGRHRNWSELVAARVAARAKGRGA